MVCLSQYLAPIIGDSECGRDRPGFGGDAVSQKLRHSKKKSLQFCVCRRSLQLLETQQRVSEWRCSPRTLNAEKTWISFISHTISKKHWGVLGGYVLPPKWKLIMRYSTGDDTSMDSEDIKDSGVTCVLYGILLSGCWALITFSILASDGQIGSVCQHRHSDHKLHWC